MADRIQTYTTRIFINAEEAKNELEILQKKVSHFTVIKEKAAKEGDWKTFNKAKHEIDNALKEMDKFGASAQRVNKTLNNLSAASVKEINKTIRLINGELKSGAIKRGSDEWKFLNEQLARCKAELRDIRGEGALTSSVWQRTIGFLNKNWGAITQIVSGISGLSMTVRKSVQDYAQMEEEMADVRKYTGLTADQVRDLNEELKKMDTRTSREQLNQLAGSAGRLGLQSKKDILEFVEAADMIGVALGDDLGEGAVDKIGKLAMAFGEDEKKGLKGAMLSTGSALNELAQNSSAQAGYLVDFTARVAGFGKQLGLTQAQIMGFGTVMDENLLRDEMAATAFGNMLTKMQTDTEKFAKIAGMDIKTFTELLNKDANAAILTLADNLKKADPQNMMKMLDDMGLDGSRAVGVLSTLADKIDDVRKHQERATDAYEKATSVQGEFNTMNSTVQARLDKCRKAFKEMAVELGGKLLPVVQYTITGAAMLAKTLSVLTNFVYNHWKSIAVLVVQVSLLVAVYKAAEVRTYAWYLKELLMHKLLKAQDFLLKARTAAVYAYNAALALLTGNITRAAAAMRKMRTSALANPYTALLAVILALGTAIYGMAKALKSHSSAIRENLQAIKEMRAAQKTFNDVKAEAAKATAEEKTRIEQLTKVIRSNAYSVGQRRAAIEKLQGIVPGYHATLSNEGVLHERNTKAIEDYIKKLDEMAMAQAIFNKKKELAEKKVENQLKKQRIQNSLNAVQAERDAHPERYVSRKAGAYVGAAAIGDGQEMNGALIESQRQEKRHNERMEEAKSEEKIIAAEERVLDKMINSNKNIRTAVTNMVTDNTGGGGTTTPTPTTPYVSDEEQKRQATAAEKARKERLEALKQADAEEKALTDARLAENMLNYRAGLQDYRQFIAEQQRIQEEGLEARRDVWDKGSAEYEKYNKKLIAMQLNGDEERNRMKLTDLEREHREVLARIKAGFGDENSLYYQNEDEVNEALFLADRIFLEEKAKLYRKGSLERMQAEWELQDLDERHRLENEQTWQERLKEVKNRYLQTGDKERETLELNALDSLHDKGLLKEEEYQRARLAIQAQYSTSQTPGEQTRQTGSDMLKVASDKARESATGNWDMPIVGTVQQYMATMEQLDALYGQDEKNHEAYLEAKRQATAQFCQGMAQQMQAAFDSINSMMSAASSYYSAQAELETAQVKKKYEKQIEAAGNNQKKIKRLQEKQAKEEAAIKTKYNRKQMKIQIAQALAQTATNALNAYGSASAIPVVGYILAPIAAAMAVAAGMLQVAAIKKQQQAQEAGYYEGGFTGGRRYRKEAGVVHEGEFVANHQAVQNPNVLPFLNFLDQAQRNNTVGSLTSQDISRSLGQGSTAVVAPVVNVQTDNGELREGLENMSNTVDRLSDLLDDGVDMLFDMEGFERAHNHWIKLKKRT